MRIIIVDAVGSGSEGRHATIDVIGCGPRTVAGVLEKLGFEFDLKPYYSVLRDPSLLNGFDILMVSAMSVDMPTVRRVRKLWSRVNDGLTVIGGPIASDPYEALIKAEFDVAFIGEAEKSLSEFLTKLRFSGDLDFLKDISGLAYRIGSEMVVNPLRPFMSRVELNSFKPSVKVIRNYWGYYACRIYVEAVRGCSNFRRTKIQLPDGRKCNDCGKCYTGPLSDRYYCPLNIPPGCGYCSVPSLFGPSRSRSIESIVDEIKGLIEVGCRRFILGASDFLDYGRDLLVEPEPLTDPSNPPPNIGAIEELLDRVKSLEREFGVRIFVSIENVKPSLVEESVAKVLGRYLHGTPVSIGIETGSEFHSIALGRPSTPHQAVKAIKILRRYGLIPYAYFIHGLPGQNVNVAIETSRVMDEAVRAGAEKITLYRFTPLPMSAFADFPKAPPSFSNEASRIIASKANELNSKLKGKWVGLILDAFIVEAFPGVRGVVAYPFMHGPVIFIENSSFASKFIGKVVKVKVVKVVSDRALSGIVLEA